MSLRLLDTDAIAAKLCRSRSHVVQRITCRADFPRRRRIDGKGQPLWIESEVDAWIMEHALVDAGADEAA